MNSCSDQTRPRRSRRAHVIVIGDRALPICSVESLASATLIDTAPRDLSRTHIRGRDTHARGIYELLGVRAVERLSEPPRNTFNDSPLRVVLQLASDPSLSDEVLHR